jgi:homoserine kinase type II
MQTLARFHLAAASIPAARGGSTTSIASRKVAPAFMIRGAVFRDLSARLATIAENLRQPLNQRLDDRASRLLQLIPDRATSLMSQVQSAAATSLPLQPAIRDIWHDHVLFTGEEVTGLVDFGALNIDTPLTDIARLVGSLVGDNLPDREQALDAYAQLRPLSADNRRLIDLLDRSGVIVAAINWLTWLYVERRDMGPPEPIARRLDEILSRLQ